MANGSEGKNQHFILEGVTETEAYRYPGGGGGDGSNIPERDRAKHAAALRGQLDAVRANAETAVDAQRDAGIEEGLGLQVEFESFPDVELAFESLAREGSGIELLNVRHEDKITRATVFVPDGKLDYFEKLVLGRARATHKKVDRGPRSTGICPSAPYARKSVARGVTAVSSSKLTQSASNLW